MIWTVPKIWNGDCFILGGGPSLRAFDVNRLKDKRVIAINNSYQIASWADVCYFMDAVWYEWHKEELFNNYHGILITTAKQQKDDPNVKFLERGPSRLGLAREPNRLVRGTNAGYGAIGIAVHLGAKRIILLGYDMRAVDGKHNWHEDHKRRVPTQVYANQFLKGYLSLQTPLEERKIEVFNATPGSELEVFPKVGIDEILNS